MRVLVTGASGLLGGGVAKALIARGDDVTVLQRRPSGLEAREVLGDIADPRSVARAVAGCDAVIHLAAKVNVTGEWADYHRVNVTGTETLLAACRTAGVSRMVFVSSPSVAHAGRSLVGAGSGAADAAHARGHYARSKALAELLALRADAGDQLAVVAVRPHLVWGPGDTQLVERIGRRARSGRLPILGSGAPLVDTIHIDNAVEAMIAALDRCEAVRGQALVVTNGEPRPIGEILAGWVRATGGPAPSRHAPARIARIAGSAVDAITSVRLRLGHDMSTDPPLTRFLAEQLSTAHWFDQRRTREALGWVPRISLDEGFSRLADWYAVHPLD